MKKEYSQRERERRTKGTVARTCASSVNKAEERERALTLSLLFSYDILTISCGAGREREREDS